MSVQDVSAQETASGPEVGEGPAPAESPALAPSPPDPVPTRLARVRARLVPGLRRTGIVTLMTLQAVLCVFVGVAIVIGLVNGGLDLVPTLGTAPVAYAEAGPPRPPPIIPPSVPLGARRDWAMWSYVDKINQAWGRDWPFVIRMFEEFDARYPGEPMVKDKLYASYIEDGRTLEARGDTVGARARYRQAANYDPSRPEAYDYLGTLDRR